MRVVKEEYVEVVVAAADVEGVLSEGEGTLLELDDKSVAAVEMLLGTAEEPPSVFTKLELAAAEGGEGVGVKQVP